DSLLAAATARPGSRVLDVGCGTGSTTLAFARRVGASGRALGVDISEPMLALARERAERARLPATFVCADAQVHAFEPASFDTIVSRFGVMFFDDPVRAFANLRRAARPGAELRFMAWRSGAENPFMTAAERAAAPLLPNLPPRDPNGPGQFAFADPDRVRRILEDGGWTGVELARSDPVCTLPEPDLTRYLVRLGPLGRVLQEADEPTRARIMDAVRPAFAPFVHGNEVRFTAACWMVAARAPAE
ncbi:MAG TPA: class I SAM-dependent methyltransferase, partial [Gammaproteobacteria bacterium]|nr:class I SAM-dependent methyltransferase [Gammaproteobacteria bacterium]